MRLTAKQIQDNYNNIKYISTNGEMYFLKEYYPICMRVENSEDILAYLYRFIKGQNG